MTIDDVTLMALADDELDADQARTLRARLEQDPDARARLERFRQTRARLQALGASAVEGTSDQTLAGDAALIARIRAAQVAPSPAAAAPVAGPDARTGRPAPANVNRAPWAALAAGLGAVAVMAALQLGGSRPDAAPEQAALASLPSGEGVVLEDGTDMTIIASFRIGSDALCREVETTRQGRTRLSILCRDAAGQPFAERFAVDIPTDDAYRPASGTIEALDAWLSAAAAGPALSPEAEAEALGR